MNMNIANGATKALLNRIEILNSFSSVALSFIVLENAGNMTLASINDSITGNAAIVTAMLTIPVLAAPRNSPITIGDMESLRTFTNIPA